MKITVERIPGNTGSDKWLATLAINREGYQVELRARGETPVAARKALEHEWNELRRAVVELLGVAP